MNQELKNVNVLAEVINYTLNKNKGDGRALKSIVKAIIDNAKKGDGECARIIFESLNDRKMLFSIMTQAEKAKGNGRKSKSESNPIESVIVENDAPITPVEFAVNDQGSVIVESANHLDPDGNAPAPIAHESLIDRMLANLNKT